MKRSAIKPSQKPLTRKKPLRPKSGLKTAQKARTKATKPKLVTLPSLIKKADAAFSRYIRLRDSELQPDGSWAGECIDGCGRLVTVINPDGSWNPGANLGHFIGRSCHHLRFSELNCNLQAAYCNAWDDKDRMLRGYAKGLDDKYGKNTARTLRRERSITRKLTREELNQVIEDSKLCLSYMLENTDKYSIIR